MEAKMKTVVIGEKKYTILYNTDEELEKRIARLEEAEAEAQDGSNSQ